VTVAGSALIDAAAGGAPPIVCAARRTLIYLSVMLTSTLTSVSLPVALLCA